MCLFVVGCCVPFIDEYCVSCVVVCVLGVVRYLLVLVLVAGCYMLCCLSVIARCVLLVVYYLLSVC